MKFLILLVLFVQSIIASDTDVAIIRRDLNFKDLVDYDGFISETHKVRTKDDYILTLYRVSSPNCSSIVGSEPIIFNHGLFLSGDDCIVPGPRGSHCYEYAKTCLDVWVVNNRGTDHSREHATLNPDKDKEYWDFSFDEMASYDMPAVIDYVLETTGKKKIVFVGHAQGVTLLINLCAAQPEYNDKVSVGFGMSTTAWLDYCKFIVIQAIGAASNVLTGLINAGLNAEFVPNNGSYQPFLKTLCGTTDLSYPACSALYFTILGDNKFQIPEDTLKVMTGHIPGGTSLKNFNRWGQIRENGFTKYDYGSVGNLKNYLRINPPEFDLSKVSMKWYFIGSKNDYVGDERDLDTLMTKLPGATKCIVSDESFGHLDYLFGKDVPKLITPMVLTYLETGNFTCL